MTCTKCKAEAPALERTTGKCWPCAFPFRHRPDFFRSARALAEQIKATRGNC